MSGIYEETGPFVLENVSIYDGIKWGEVIPDEQLADEEYTVLEMYDTTDEEEPIRGVIPKRILLGIARDIVMQLGTFGELN